MSVEVGVEKQKSKKIISFRATAELDLRLSREPSPPSFRISKKRSRRKSGTR
jgi:hypothetical protein